jgi:hypothetical protein
MTPLSDLPDLQASFQDSLAVLDKLLCQPAYTLSVAACFRSSLLRLTSSLTELHLERKARRDESSQEAAAFSVALAQLLEVAPHLSRCDRLC